MADARAYRMRSVNHMEFAVFDNGQPNVSKVGMFEGDPNHPACKISVTNMIQAIETPAEQSFQRFDQNTQAMVQQEQKWARERALEQSQSRGMHM